MSCEQPSCVTTSERTDAFATSKRYAACRSPRASRWPISPTSTCASRRCGAAGISTASSRSVSTCSRRPARIPSRRSPASPIASTRSAPIRSCRASTSCSGTTRPTRSSARSEGCVMRGSTVGSWRWPSCSCSCGAWPRRRSSPSRSRSRSSSPAAGCTCSAWISTCSRCSG